jgi:hypothetical protein
MTRAKRTTKSTTQEKSIKKRKTWAPVITREKILMLSTLKTTHPRIWGNIEVSPSLETD